MVLELVAGRLVSRYVGQSLYTWTAIIGVMLAGISLGNYLGGRIADRSSSRATLALQFLLAAAACLVVLGLNVLAGSWSLLAERSYPVRIALHMAVTFLLPSAVLGTISPVIARRALRLGHATGRTMGDVYAWSIAGSIVGTFFTGFLLLTWMSYTIATIAVAVFMALVALLYAAGHLLSRKSEGPTRTETIDIQSTAPVPQDSGSAAWIALVLTIVVANASVMAIEIAAGRLMSRYYGQSLYTWTSVIGVVLAGMSFGSCLGGRWADRYRNRAVLATLFVSSSITSVLILTITNAIQKTQVLALFSWPIQIASHAALTLFIPSLLMGAVSPVVVKMALERGYGAGRTVGNLYAWASLGSIAGTFLAGYWLIALVGMAMTIFICSCSLVIMAVLYGRRSVASWSWAMLCLLAAVGSVFPAAPGIRFIPLAVSLRLLPAPGTVYLDESQYSYISVLADAEDPDIRQMVLDKLIHSKINLKDPRDLRYEYEWIYAAVMDKIVPPEKPVTAMVIGGGGYAFPHYLEVARPGSYIEVSEIDPAVTEAAHAAFGFPRDTAVKVFDTDARRRVDDLTRDKRAQRPVPTFDLIFGDSINDYSVPYHLTTVEFNQRLAELLSEDGAYVLNLIDMFNSGRFLAAIVNTCRQTFPHVTVFRCGTQSNERETFIVVCSRKPVDLDSVPDELRAKYPYAGSIVSPDEIDKLMRRTGNILLTDNFAPVDNMLAPVVRLSQDARITALLRAADTALAEGNLDRALRRLDAVLRTRAEHGDARELKAVILMRIGDLENAAKELRTLTAAEPKRATAFHHLGAILFQTGDFNGAVKAWRGAVAAKPDYAAAYESLGAALVKTGDSASAIEVLGRAMELNPRSAPLHINLAVALFNTADTAGAIREFQQALSIDPSSKGVYFQLAVAYWKIKDYDNAWKAIQSAQSRGEAVDNSFVNTLEQDSGRTR